MLNYLTCITSCQPTVIHLVWLVKKQIYKFNIKNHQITYNLCNFKNLLTVHCVKHKRHLQSKIS